MNIGGNLKPGAYERKSFTDIDTEAITSMVETAESEYYESLGRQIDSYVRKHIADNPEDIGQSEEARRIDT